jgi:hypothetical protein
MKGYVGRCLGEMPSSETTPRTGGRCRSDAPSASVADEVARPDDPGDDIEPVADADV